MEKLEWGQPVKGWRLSLSLDKKVFTTGETILATIVFENISSKGQSFGGHGRDFDYDWDCRNEAGEKMPFTLYGKRMVDNRGEGKATGGTLGPNENIVVEIPLTRHIDLSLPGKYTVTVSREVFAKGRSDPPIISNTVTFEIEE